MQAIILAAGRSSRLASALQGQPKCLAPLDDLYLIEYQLEMLRYCGITEVCIVLGYRAEEVRSVVGRRCHYILNERYAETNSLYSLSLARHWVRETFLVLNCDVLAHPHIYRQLLATPGNALAYDSRSGTEDEHMKVVFANGQLQRISKALPAVDSQGENVGLLKFATWSVEPFFREAQAALALEGDNQWAPAAVQRFALNWPMGGVDITGMPWIEIDFPEDLEAASTRVWPTIRPVFHQAIPLAA
ncbi:MAG: phosphocholine cytidylyltransferase family protein [Candidatus Tectomicrobia bacterium]|uniref:Phosphocholine cytidylyltransferase family protein n=1 Tax=Tectimicrobiota bacterium TaxID=2528274 RepID=A0A938B4H2_UNCTE|nr:phosphocholine cytidylyltransferase family protein [Candidatus Tectomicrobia bacterium]